MNNLIPTIKYLGLTLKHKYFVFRAGLKIECPIWRLILHDWTKFLPSELPYYGRQFFGDGKDEYGFNKAWLHHQNFNDHHWEFWILRTHHDRSSSKKERFVLMPMEAVKEMVSDWLGASRAYEGKWPKSLQDWDWFNTRFDKIRIPDTVRSDAIYLLEYHFFRKLNWGIK